MLASGVGTFDVLYDLFLFLANGHYLRVREGCANMHKNPPRAAAQGEFPVRPFLDLRQATFHHFNWVNDNNGADSEQAAVTEFVNGLSEQRFGFLELTDQEPRCREWSLRRYFPFFLTLDVTQPKSIFSDLHIDGVCKEPAEHLVRPYNV